MRVLILVTTCVAITACGGGGSGAGGANAAPHVFTGPYHLARLFRNGSGIAAVGTADSDDWFRGSGILSSDLGGMVSEYPIESEFEVDPDRTLVVDGSIQGGLTPDGRVANMGNLGASFGLFLTRTGRYDVASLTGTFRFVLIGTTVGGSTSCMAGTMTFDGTGNTTSVMEVINTDGSLTAGTPINGVGVYEVTGSGDVIVDVGTLRMKGGVGYDGHVLVLGGGIGAGNSAATAMMIRESGAADDARLSGEYFAVIHEFDASVADTGGSICTFASAGDGTGIMTYLSRRRGGAASVPSPDGATYSVGAGGVIDMVLDGQDLRGVVSADGNIAVIGGGMTAGNRPAIVSLIRK
ncbi:MAG: hypothetical protein QNJ98_11540 [Planctomycetota bacterium]|nr:hypothetical protein [Planctomycetota bacterium]